MLRLAFLLLLPTLASAQTLCPTAQLISNSTATPSWTPPFDRNVSLRARDITLREALDRVAAAARLRFSYSSESLTLDRRVCVAADDRPVGEVLAHLLSGSSVNAVSAGGDQVVLVVNQSEALPEIIPLEEIVVTGSTSGMPRRSLTVAVDVIQGSQLENSNVSNLADVLRAGVPGMWLWQQSPNNLLAQYASVRGASSFGLTYPKIYLDGIELANPLLLSRIAPSSIERIEAIRGPQGAALYGADAISGVINVVTRNQGFDRADRVGVGSNLGVTASGFANETVLRQQHTVDYQTGSNLRSWAMTLTGGETDEFFPGAFARELSGLARFRTVRQHFSFNGTGRIFAQETGNAISPLLIEAIPAADTLAQRLLLAFSDRPQQVLQYTLGGTITFSKSERWTHSLVAGVDGYELDNVANIASPLPTPLDSALQAARGGATRVTLRGSSMARVGDAATNSGTVTFAVEHSNLRKDAPEEFLGGFRQVVSWQNNTGLIGQFNGSFAERAFLTGGLRLEHNEALTGHNQVAALPMLGAAYVHDFTAVSAKLRAAYGRGIRAPHAGVRELAMHGDHRPLLSRELEPESQSGIEAGVDLWFGKSASLQLTRFDQTASGLIQQVAITIGPEDVRRRPIRFMQQNVGEISNQGWELQATYQLQSLSVTANYASVDSRVQNVAPGYTGDLLPGDRMLNVPAHTASITALWQPAQWSASVSAARAFDWIGYDRLSLAAAYLDDERPSSGFVGSQLRAYWREYEGVTWLRASLGHDVARRFTLTLVGDNLLNHQAGEPDDLTILPGRTLSLGLRARF
jgi:outer membrane receptor protein involved in Fe transport